MASTYQGLDLVHVIIWTIDLNSACCGSGEEYMEESKAP